MEARVVRESSFRHLTGSTVRDGRYSGLKINIRGSCPLVRANATTVGVPWETAGGGTLAIIPLDSPGRLQGPPILLDCHAQAILAFDLHQFKDGLMATGSREEIIKVWDYGRPDKSPVMVMKGHTKRVNSLNFHPTANNVMVSTSGDLTARLWDLEKGVEQICLQGHTAVIESVAWQPSGQLLATWCKDNKIRVFDARAKQMPIKEHHMSSNSSGKTVQLTWVGQDRLFTTGFVKDSRQLAVWDVSGNIQELHSQIIDSSPNLQAPFFEDGTGLVFVGGKGNLIYFYEMLSEDPFVFPLNKMTLPENRSEIFMLPKRLCNVTNCEIARFLAVSSDAIDTISFTVPRKSSHLFQEDLFPPVPSGEAALSSSQWFAGQNAPPRTISMQPEGMVSVYSVDSNAEGGRSRKKDAKRANIASSSSNDPASERENGWLEVERPGWFFSAYVRCWAEVKSNTLYCFDNPESAHSLERIALAGISLIQASDSSDVVFHLTAPQRVINFRAKTEVERNEWVSSLIQFKDKHAALKFKRKKEKKDKEVAVIQPEDYLDGDLHLYTEGMLYNWWNKVWAKIQDDAMHVYQNHNSSVLMQSIHLDKINGLLETDIFQKMITFQISTSTRVFHFMTTNEEERTLWMQHLRKKHVKRDQERDADYVEEAEDELHQVQGYVDVKGGMLSIWSRQWFTAVGSLLCYFKNPQSLIPFKKIPLSEIKSIELSTIAPTVAFQLTLQDGSILHHRLPTEEQRNTFMNVIHNLKSATMFALNLLESFELSNFDSHQLPPSVQIIQLTEVKSGKQPLLIQVRGRRLTRVELVPMASSSFNSGTVFILDVGTTIYQWNGSKANRINKAKALDLANRIRQKERGGKATVFTIEEGEDSKNSQVFWEIIGGKGSINPPPENDEPPKMVLDIYKVSDDSIFLVHHGAATSKSKLDPNFSFVVDSGTEVYSYIGKNATLPARKFSMQLAKKLAVQKQQTAFVTKIFENGETILFKEKFTDYPGMLPISTVQAPIISNVAVGQTQEKIDVAKMIQGKEPAQLQFSNEGKVKIFLIKQFDKEEYPVEKYGHFYSGDCFLVVYTYFHKNIEKNLIFFWQGRDATINEKGSSAYLVKETAQENSKIESSQIRVVQSMESSSFLAIFKGKLIVHKGKYNEKPGEMSLFDIRGSNEHNTKAVQSDCKGQSLSSFHCFVLQCNDSLFIWNGKQSNLWEKQAASGICDILLQGRDIKVVNIEEGKEPDEFWKLLGGKPEEYHCPSYQRKEPRMFLFSAASGTVKSEEVFALCQDSLENNMVAMIDLLHEVYIWFGEKSSHNEQKIAMETAQEYLKASTMHSDRTPILITKKYHEPLAFRSIFQAWSATRSKYLSKEPASSVWCLPIEEVMKEYTKIEYSYEELLRDPPPKGVDPTKLEEYLSDKEFLEIFKMSKQDYQLIPVWKRGDIKRQHYLF